VITATMIHLCCCMTGSAFITVRCSWKDINKGSWQWCQECSQLTWSYPTPVSYCSKWK